jgi:hypothetical protein
VTLNDAELAALEDGATRIGVFFRLDTDPVVRIWLGFGDIAPGVNAYDPQGAVYLGFGEIQNLPTFKQLINGMAERVDFTVSGVSGDILELASGGAPEQVKGKRVAFGFALMDPAWLMLGPVKWCANYTADYLSINQAPTDDPLRPIVRTIGLSCGTLLTARRRPALSYFSDQDQKARSPGDRFCERTPIYCTGFNKAWPTFPPP